SADEVRAVASLGQRDFGENQVQEAVDKIRLLADIALSWHFIGAIQSNKCRDIAANFDWVHSIDRFKIARRLSQMRPQSRGPLNLFLQVNLQEEQTKSGVTADNVEDLANSVLTLPYIRLCGLMAIPKPATDFDAQRRVFRRLFELQDHLRSKGLPLDCLSMGMTDDMDAAIAEGATHVRIGTAIFGPRQ
ncbi:MAG TPA: YggS family pyridoxal phosphate-dependent enzyme, partial [Arenicellales bacterium]|nr:YggS family pyridoxal phosphate-dependent enzyme [Arenicellales bacterium]